MAEDPTSVQESETQTATMPAAEHATDYDPEGFFTPAVIRHNMKMVILAEAVLMTGSKDLQIAMSPLLNFLTKSSAHPYTIQGLIQALAFASIVGSFFTPFITRRFPYKKWYYLTVVSAWAVMPILLGIGLIVLPQFQATMSPQRFLTALMFLTIGCYSTFQLLGGFTNLPHNEYFASCIPPSHRGRMYGISSSLYSALSVGATAISYLILKKTAAPGSYGYIFVMTGMIWLFGFSFVAFAKEKRTPVEKSPKPWTGAMLKAFWHDRPYMNLLAFQCVNRLSIIPFFWALPNFGLRELGMADKTVPVVQGIGLAATILTAAPLGWLIDKLTPKRSIPLCMSMICAGYLLFYIFYSPMGFYVSYGLISIPFIAYFPSLTILSVSIPKPEHRGGHFAIQAIALLTFNSIGMFLIGLLSDAFRSTTFIRMLDAIHLNYEWLKGPRLLLLLMVFVAFGGHFLAKRLFRVLGDTWSSYS